MVKIKLFFQTDSGCDCLLEEQTISFCSMGEVRRKARFIAQRFWDNNKETAQRLVDGWRRDGEEVDMWPLAECADDERVEKALNDVFDEIAP